VETNKVYLRDTTIVSPFSILLFGGSINVHHQVQLAISCSLAVSKTKMKYSAYSLILSVLYLKNLTFHCRVDQSLL